MAPEHHAGGWVDRDDGRGWVLVGDVGTPDLIVPTAPVAVDESPAPTEPDRAACPDCGILVRLKKDGTLRKHTCVDAGTVAADEAAHQTTTDTPPETADQTESEASDG